METQVNEIAPDIYRLSTYVSDADFMFNQFLIDADQPLLFHTGLRSLFPLISAAVARVIPTERLQWTTGTLLCGDLFTMIGNSPALTEQEITGPALQTEDTFRATCLTPATGPAIRALAALQPRNGARLHGPGISVITERDQR